MRTSHMQQTTTRRDPVHGRVIYLLILVVIVQFIWPITEGNSPFWLLAYQALYMTLMVSGILVARGSPQSVRDLIVFAVLWIFAGAAYVFNQDALWAQLAGYAMIACFQITVVTVLLKYIFRAKTVNRDVLYAASAVYLLLGAIFVPVFGTIESLTFAWTSGQHAFTDSVVAVGEIFTWQNLA